MVAPVVDPYSIWVLDLLHSSGDAGKWRREVTMACPCFMWLKIYETKKAQQNVVAQLGAWSPEHGACRFVDCGWDL
ncbi:hypothetical protein ACOSP7_022570 [Xanthoceras sorbifolium]